MKGKIIFCEALDVGDGPLSAGAKGQILEDADNNDGSFIFPFPSTVLDLRNGDRIKSYISSTK